MATSPEALGAGGESGEDDALLLAGMGAGVALAGAGPRRATDVGELDVLGKDVREAAGHHLPGAHVARLLLDPGDLLQVRVAGDDLLELVLGEGIQQLDPGDGDVLGALAALAAI